VGSFTIYDVQAAEYNRSRRELPRVIAGALRLLWAAGRRQLLTILVVEALAAAGVAAAVLLGREVLAGVLEADRTGGGWDDFAGPLVALAAVSTLLTIAHALASRQQQLLSELTGRHAQSRIHDVSCTVELAAFDDPAFHDRVARAQGGAFRATNIVHGLVRLVASAAAVIGSLVALAALQPILLPLGLLAVVPAAMLSSRRADAYYRFAFAMTPRDRERHYLSELLTARDPAKEVRAMGLAGFLRRRHDRLYDERIEELAGVTRRQTRSALLAGLASSLVIGATLALLLALALDERLSLPEAGAAAGAMVLLGQRLTMGGFNAEMLLESALMI
jgi:ATP-binding cassette, subfamily B, bacterial